jgi:hypothetical protein
MSLPPQLKPRHTLLSLGLAKGFSLIDNSRWVCGASTSSGNIELFTDYFFCEEGGPAKAAERRGTGR